MLLDRVGIDRLIPQCGAMVLLDQVISYDEKSILCTTMSHRRSDNPLRRDGKLPAVCGAEYGAQGAAVHGPLVAGQLTRPGQIVLLRDLSWTRPFLCELAEPLDVRAHCLHKDSRNLAYGFTLSAGGETILRGECGIILS